MTDDQSPILPEQTEQTVIGDSADPLLTTAQAAARMGKTYRQFTAYVSYQKQKGKPMPVEGDPPMYRLSVIDAHAQTAKTRARGKTLIVAPSQADRAEQNQEALPLAMRIADMAVRLDAAAARVDELAERNDALHERLHQQEREARERESAMRAEHKAHTAELRAIIEHERQKVEAERQKREEAERLFALSWWQKMIGRGRQDT